MNQSEILLELRKSKKLTLEQLAKKTGISKNMLWHLEKGDRTGTIETLQKISNFYGVSLDYITNNATKSALLDEFVQGLVNEGIIQDSEHIPADVEKQILDLVKLKIKKLL